MINYKWRMLVLDILGCWSSAQNAYSSVTQLCSSICMIFPHGVPTYTPFFPGDSVSSWKRCINMSNQWQKLLLNHPGMIGVYDASSSFIHLASCQPHPPIVSYLLIRIPSNNYLHAITKTQSCKRWCLKWTSHCALSKACVHKQKWEIPVIGGWVWLSETDWL